MYLRGVTFIYLAKGTVSEGTNQARDLLSSLNSFPSYYRLWKLSLIPQETSFIASLIFSLCLPYGPNLLFSISYYLSLGRSFPLQEVFS